MIKEQNDKKVAIDLFDGYLSYATEYGKCLCGDSLEILDKFEDNSIDLPIVISITQGFTSIPKAKS